MDRNQLPCRCTRRPVGAAAFAAPEFARRAVDADENDVYAGHHGQAVG
nr:hypothetical protein [Nocardia flavorosea]